jgi:CheY-like chemotaxis protein
MTAEKLLVVDDEQILRIGTAWTLRESGYTVDEADSGRAALEMIKTTRYSVIFMDLNMPGMGGFECAGKIRAWEKEARPMVQKSVIIALSASLGSDIKAHSLRADMNDFLEKSATKEELKALIQKYRHDDVPPQHPQRTMTDLPIV